MISNVIRLATISATVFSAIIPANAETVCKDDRKIVGGVDAKIEDQPWQVALAPDGQEFECGGTLIQDKWVLTAAHCFASKTPSGARIKGGVTNRETGTWIETGKIFVHQGYSGAPAYENDIALVKLSGTIAGDIIPIAQPGLELKPCQLLEVTGWGRIKEDAPPATILQKAEIPLMDNDTCNAKDAYAPFGESALWPAPIIFWQFL